MNHLKIYLSGFFFTTMGLLTVMFMAATYATKELGLTDSVLIPTILADSACRYARSLAFCPDIRTVWEYQGPDHFNHYLDFGMHCRLFYHQAPLVSSWLP